ncbi:MULTISPECIES: SgrR family transcriptional regulator [Aliivibrio]|uniref:Oligopeptide-binding protein OppA n=1 Tax=Aliivibrio fischeri (strain MJ11) TaxID=388396 RepID=B5ETV1_ALIFM|nr:MULTISPECIES: SgrR family transcriptional regulator [Aliivibrio]ACH64193.1 oligopeptide-binding protein OppA [Aliivibrio fischeri MJ11]MBD1571189.1 SgrR family transcriptional regulator [Aliivibrio sp. S10_S31]MCE4936138.1 SgrR family transcriptional regulator [Aliivibrio fischeri]OCH10540.1 transcriptional regulator [Aliivibrio fischeri]OCH26295.1 transcriptional regulator [Aliivibrio fischeri]
MGSPRLRKQFEKLYGHYHLSSDGVQIDDIADLLCCTRRNTRMVLKKMSEEKWIDWIPAVGRGKSSVLEFLSTPDTVYLSLARRNIEDGKLDVALDILDGNQDALLDLIHKVLGVSHEKGKQVVKLPYYRQLNLLKPSLAIRRSEQHLMQQIFNGLTQWNKQGEVEGDIAHHWEMLSPTHWRFYLRPSIYFHDGKLLTFDDIKETFTHLKTNYVFSHIEDVLSPNLNVIDFILNKDDHYFDSKLAQFNAKLVPATSHDSDEQQHLPIGSGPYKVAENTDKKLILVANEQYFGYRPLIDSVEVWTLPEIAPIQLKLGLEVYEGNDQSLDSYGETVDVDRGCSYLLFNRKTGIAKDQNWLSYLLNTITPLLLLNELQNSTMNGIGLFNAYGLLPGFQHCLNRTIPPYELPERGSVVHLGFENEHPLYPLLGKIIKQRLDKDGIILKIHQFDTLDLLDLDKAATIDIWLRGMSLGTQCPEALLSWLFAFDEIERVMPEDDFQTISNMIEKWQSTSQCHFPVNDICRFLIDCGQINPLFHGWMGISEDTNNSIQNASCNGLGWFDFEKVWIKPTL